MAKADEHSTPLTRRTVLSASAATVAIAAPAAILVASTDAGSPDPVIKLVADSCEAERVFEVASDAEEAARRALPDAVRDPRITVTFADFHRVIVCRTAKEVDFAYRQGALAHAL